MDLGSVAKSLCLILFFVFFLSVHDRRTKLLYSQKNTGFIYWVGIGTILQYK